MRIYIYIFTYMCLTILYPYSSGFEKTNTGAVGSVSPHHPEVNPWICGSEHSAHGNGTPSLWPSRDVWVDQDGVSKKTH